MIFVPPVQPPIFVPGELLTGTVNLPLVGTVGLTNTLLATLLIEGMYNTVEASAGKWAPKFFPWVMTIILMVLVANWMELIPGVDSIGKLEPAHAGATGAPAVQLLPGVCAVARPGSPFANGT